MLTASVDAGDLLGGRYEIEREHGVGAMAIVYLARDTKCHRRVAIKILNAECSDQSAVDRFRNEIATIASLQHPNIMPLFDCGDVNGAPYYVMPFIDGETLRSRLDRERQLPIGEAVRIAVSVARALHCAHRRGVIHRDIKPENILLCEGDVMIADFGIAFSATEGSPRLTQSGTSIGTPLYMSPEQAAGDETVDHRSDIYSLAVVLYEMLCGETPHAGPNTRAIIARILTYRASPAAALRRTISRGLDAALALALEKQPSDRFASAGEFADVLEVV